MKKLVLTLLALAVSGGVLADGYTHQITVQKQMDGRTVYFYGYNDDSFNVKITKYSTDTVGWNALDGVKTLYLPSTFHWNNRDYTVRVVSRQYTPVPNQTVEKLELPDTLWEIGATAFYNFKKLKSVKIPWSVNSVDGTAFGDCDQLTTMSMPASAIPYCGSYNHSYACKAVTDLELVDGVPDVNDLMVMFPNLKRLTYPSVDSYYWNSGYGASVLSLMRSVGVSVMQSKSLFDWEDYSTFRGSQTFLGWQCNAAGLIAGTITVKAGKPATKAPYNSKVTVTTVPLRAGAKKQVRKLVVPAHAGNPVVAGIRFGDEALSGTFNGASVEAGKDLYKDKLDTTSKPFAQTHTPVGMWAFALKTPDGYAGFSVNVKNNKGKTSLKGSMPDGTKVSVSAQGVYGSAGSNFAAPFIYTKKSPLGLVFWPETGSDGVVTALMAENASLTDCSRLKMPAANDGYALIFSHSDLYRVCPAAASESYLRPMRLAFRNGAFVKEKPGKVKRMTDFGTLANPNELAFKYNKKDGTVKGTFVIHSEEWGKVKRTKFTVKGIFVNGVMYGTAVNKKLGMFPVMIAIPMG